MTANPTLPPSGAANEPVAVLVEREACAKIADRIAAHDPNITGSTDERITHRHAGMDIASAIRARGSAPPSSQVEQAPVGTSDYYLNRIERLEMERALQRSGKVVGVLQAPVEQEKPDVAGIVDNHPRAGAGAAETVTSQAPVGDKDRAELAFALQVAAIDPISLPPMLVSKTLRNARAMIERDGQTIADLRRDLAKVNEAHDKLVVKYRDEVAIVDRVWRALGITSYAGANGREISEIVADNVRNLRHWREECGSLHSQLARLKATQVPPTGTNESEGK